MNLPNKLAVSRIVLTFFILFFMLFPFYAVGLSFPKYLVEGVLVDTRFVVAGVLFIIASITDFLDGFIARKKNLVTEGGMLLDSLADKILVDSVLVVFASIGFVNVLVPVIVIIRDVFVNGIKMMMAIKGKVIASIPSGKVKTCSFMLGIILLFFYNLPFEMWNIRIDLFLIYFATIMSVVSLFWYYQMNKNILFPKNKK